MFAPFSLISSIKVQVLHPQRCPPAKPELTSDILRIRAASKLQKQKVFKLLLDITHREKKKMQVLFLLLKKIISTCCNYKLLV